MAREKKRPGIERFGDKDLEGYKITPLPKKEADRRRRALGLKPKRKET